MGNRIKVEMEKIEIPKGLHKRSKLGVQKVKLEQRANQTFLTKFNNLNIATRVAVIAGGLLLSAGVGTYAIDNQMFFFLDSTGSEKAIEFTKEPNESESDTLIADYAESYDELVKKYYVDKLEPGEVAAFYSVKEVKESTAANPPQLYYYDKSFIYTEFNKFKDSIDHSFQPSYELADDYVFTKGSISNWFDLYSKYDKGRLIAKARHSDEENVEEIFKATGEQREVNAFYSNRMSEVIVSSSVLKLPIDEYQFEEDTVLEPVIINGYEALYIREEETKYPFHNIRWMDDENGKTIMYSVSSSDLVNVTKEDLVSMAESIRSHQSRLYKNTSN
jgi:hypothetical protein